MPHFGSIAQDGNYLNLPVEIPPTDISHPHAQQDLIATTCLYLHIGKQKLFTCYILPR